MATFLPQGFDSVMVDGSHLPYEENVAYTRRVARAARARGMSVEAELGRLSGTEDGLTVQEYEAKLTDVGQVRERPISKTLKSRRPQNSLERPLRTDAKGRAHRARVPGQVHGRRTGARASGSGDPTPVESLAFVRVPFERAQGVFSLCPRTPAQASEGL